MLVTQLDVYTEEKFEDEEDMRERAKNIASEGGHSREASESTKTLEAVLRLAKEDEELVHLVTEIFLRYETLLQRDASM